jgi:signal peptidase I
MIFRWLTSSTVRRAVAMRRHVAKLLAAQRDILSPQAMQNVNDVLAALRKTVEQGADKTALHAQMQNLEDAANKWLKPYPNPAWRENVEVLLVAIAVAMAIRTFFLQPFKIPTGSMQPTLYGITHENLIGNTNAVAPGFLGGLFNYWFNGISYFHVVAKTDGALENFERTPKRLLLFNLSQRFQIGGQTYTVWFPPEKLLERARLVDDYGNRNPHIFKAGEDVIKLKTFAGDHLFVNRLIYNFRHPRRGEIIVFSTKGFDSDAAARYRIDRNQYYIKRLVALGGEKVRIGNDQHLIIDGRRLDASVPHFENIYNFQSNAGENQYFGHIFARDPEAILVNASQELTVQPNHYMVMGDNTRNSLDSRYLGDFAREYVIGKSSFVYWPIGPIGGRFGFGYN